MATIIDGKAVSAAIREEITKEVESFKAETGVTPGLAVIIVGEDPASTVYVRNKHKACQDVGMFSEVRRMKEETTEEELLAVIDEMNRDEKLHGILVQLPLPRHIDEKKVIRARIFSTSIMVISSPGVPMADSFVALLAR